MQLVSKEACRAGIRSGKRRSKGNWETVKLILGIKVNEGRLKRYNERSKVVGEHAGLRN